MDLEEIKEVIRETLAEELQILRKQIIECVEAAAADAFAKLRVWYEKDCHDELNTSEHAHPKHRFQPRIGAK
jgi:hypothetical protein